MKHSVQNSNTFLAYYNQIDKYLAYILGLTKYMPYNEKLVILADGNYSVSNFVHAYQNKLRYFGDLRNQLVHGFRLENKHYVLASDYAVEEIEKVYEELRKPTSVSQAFGREVYTCTLDDVLREVIIVMRQELNTHVPVYDKKGNFVEMLSESTIAYRIADQIGDDGEIHLADIKVGDVSLKNTNDEFVFVEASKSIYDIEQLFAQTLQAKKRLGAAFVTKTGSSDEVITGIVTAMDLPRLADHFVL